MTTRACSLALLVAALATVTACGDSTAEDEDIAASSEEALIAGPGSLEVNKTMLKVSFGMTAADVRNLLGKPDSVQKTSSEILGTVELYSYGKTTFGIAGEVISMFTQSTRVRTSNDIGVGTPEVSLKTRIPEVKCKSANKNVRFCTAGSSKPGEHMTSFEIVNDKVASINVYEIVD